MEDRRNRLSMQVVDEVRKHFPQLVASARIPRTVRLAEAPSYGKPISVYDPHSNVRGVRRAGPRAHYADQVARADRAVRGWPDGAHGSRARLAPAGAGCHDGASSALPPSRRPNIPLERVRPKRQQPRTSFDADGIAELAASIRTPRCPATNSGLTRWDGYELVAGHRRVLRRVWRRRHDPRGRTRRRARSLELALVENLQRADLNAIETARAYKLLMRPTTSPEQVAERVGKSRSQVANMLRALTAPQPLRMRDGREDQRGPSARASAAISFGCTERSRHRDRASAIGARRGGTGAQDGPPDATRP